MPAVRVCASAARPPSRNASTKRAGSRKPTAGHPRSRSGYGPAGWTRSAQQATHALEPPHSLELEDVRELACADPRPKDSASTSRSRTAPTRFCPTNSRRWLGVAAQQRHVVLPEHPRGHVAHDEPRLGRHGGRGSDPKRAGKRSREGEAVVQPGGYGIENVGQRIKVHGRPLGAAHHLRRRRGRGGREARVAGHRSSISRHSATASNGGGSSVPPRAARRATCWARDQSTIRPRTVLAQRSGKRCFSSATGANRSPRSSTRSSTSPASNTSASRSAASTSSHSSGAETVGRSRARSE